jgi:hypothetical protein
MTAVTQTWDPDRYRKNAGFVAELGMPVVDLLAPKPGERILDLMSKPSTPARIRYGKLWKKVWMHRS